MVHRLIGYAVCGWLVLNGAAQGQVPLRYKPLEQSKLTKLTGVYGFSEIQPGQGRTAAIAGSPARGVYVTGGINPLDGSTTDSFLSYWDVDAGSVLREMRITGHAVTALSLSPDGTRAVAGLVKVNEKGEATSYAGFIDLKTGQFESKVLGKDELVLAAAYSARNGRTLLGSQSGKLYLFEAGKKVGEIAAPDQKKGPVFAAQFLPDGIHAVISHAEGGPRLWNLDKPAEVRAFAGLEEGALFLAVAADGKRVAGSNYNLQACVWDAASGKKLAAFNLAEKNPVQLDMMSLALDEEGKRLFTLVSGLDPLTATQPKSFLASWDVDAGKLLWTVDGTWRGFVPMVVGGKSIVLGGGASAFERRGQADGKLEAARGPHTAAVVALALAGKGQLLSAGLDGSVRLWQKPGNSATSIKAMTSGITSLVVDAKKRYFITAGTDHTVKIWNQNSGMLEHTLKGHSDTVTCLAVTPDGAKIISAGNDRTVRVWDAATGEALQTFTGHSENINAVAVSPDGKWIVSASDDNTIRFWPFKKKLLPFELIEIPAHKRQVTCLAFSPDGKYLASGSQDKTINIWNAGTQRRVSTLEGHQNWVTGLAFLGSGRIVSAGDDLSVRIWDIAMAKQIDQIDLGSVSDCPKCLAVDGDDLLVGTAGWAILGFRIEAGKR